MKKTLAPLTRAVVACALAACATMVSGCSSEKPASGTENPWRVSGTITLAPFSEITTETCLGDYLLLDKQVQITDCATPGAMQVVGVTSFGDAAPADSPTDLDIAAMAEKVCAPLIGDWTQSQLSVTTHPFSIFSYPDEWSGPSTPLICAVGA
jgi:hypothetical protein